MKLEVTRNFDLKILDLNQIIGNIQINTNKALREAAEVVNSNIKKEFKATNKRGVTNLNNQYAKRRSTNGQSLAKDTGVAMDDLLTISKPNSSTIEGGFLDNSAGKGGNYIAEWDEGGRSVIKPALDKGLRAIETIFNKNFSPK